LLTCTHIVYHVIFFELERAIALLYGTQDCLVTSTAWLFFPAVCFPVSSPRCGDNL
jgi:hypothetical protein